MKKGKELKLVALKSYLDLFDIHSCRYEKIFVSEDSLQRKEVEVEKVIKEVPVDKIVEKVIKKSVDKVV